MEMLTVAETELVATASSRSHEPLTYFDAGLQSDPPQGLHLPRVAVMDVLSSGISTGAEVKYLPVESSPSVVTLLHDQLESQSKATIVLSFFYLLCLDHIACLLKYIHL